MEALSNGLAHGHLAGGGDGRTDARRAPGEPLPVLVLTGYLGAGKTTLLNHLLSGAPGLRIAAIVNDFGEIDVDATAVADRVDSMVSLANGCVCCEVDASELAGTLGRLADPGMGLDLAVIEASGLAEPSVLSRMVHDVPRDVVRHAGMIQVVDAEGLDDAMERHPRLAAHLAEADLVVVNKCDLVTRERFGELRSTIRAHAPRVAVLPAVRAAVPAGLLLGLEPAAPRTASTAAPDGGHAPGGDAHNNSHLHDGYTAVTVAPAGHLHPRRFLAAVSAPPTGAYRAKGTLTLADADGPRRYEVALVGRRLELRAGGSGPDGLVVIGVGMDDDEVTRFLDEAVLTPGEHVDPAAGLGLHPYLIGDPDSSDVEEWIYDEQRAAPLTGTAAMLADPEDPEAFDPAFTP
ncbi:CobW family GTP-binding protein [Dietzia cinnamea]|uniref:CobW family GTP-binding protein n=1 Tax=Dietzia cinnamea TaxID=321318 RepID=UPI00223BD06E|nr:GTP-binding protein [Dietzia cinnamea]MCT2062417.1 GTP-binding protein [Dietzia cinnamea]MCT2237466.1 GTP-binding protein [Dietzia cinnamea]MCT2299802.1 GTP-binding protein [Dietzia cinnamea]